MSIVLKAPDDARPSPAAAPSRLDWRRFNPFARAEAVGGGPTGGAGKRKRPHWGWAVAGIVALAVIVFLALFQWNWLRGPIGRYASAQTGRLVRLDGDLKVHLLTLTPRIEIGGLRIGNPAWAPQTLMAQVDTVVIEVKLLPLLLGQVRLPLVSIEHPQVALFRDAQGRANWDFSNGKPGGGKPLKLPPIQTFVIDQGRLQAADLQRKLAFTGTIEAHEHPTSAYDQGFHLDGQGTLNTHPFLMKVVGGPLLNVQADRPYPFDASITAGATHIVAKGQVPKPFNLGILDATVSVQGRDLNELYDLTGLALPNTPPYQVSGRLRRDGLTYYYDGFTGRVGKSDLNGDVEVDTASGRPMVKARLNSRLLDFADLAGLFGAPGASKAAAPEQKAQTRALAAQGRLLPDATLQVDRIRSMDAKVTYTADQVRTQSLPLKSVSLGATLDHGLLTLDPIGLQFPTGKLTGQASLDARPKVPVTKVDLRVANIRLEELFPAVKGQTTVSGGVMARARLTGTGDSVHKAAASADGAVTVVIPRGQIRQAFAELMGIDVTKGLFLLLGKDQSPTGVRCALADFKATNGVLTATRIVFDTGVVLVTGSGTVNLADESLALRFQGAPKQLRAVRVIAPITIGGQLRQPRLGIEPGAAVAQAGIGVALATLLTPLAAILPFVSPGLDKDADCASLFAEARQSRAPVANAPKATLPPLPMPAKPAKPAVGAKR